MAPSARRRVHGPRVKLGHEQPAPTRSEGETWTRAKAAWNPQERREGRRRRYALTGGGATRRALTPRSSWARAHGNRGVGGRAYRCIPEVFLSTSRKRRCEIRAASSSELVVDVLRASTMGRAGVTHEPPSGNRRGLSVFGRVTPDRLRRRFARGRRRLYAGFGAFQGCTRGVCGHDRATDTASRRSAPRGSRRGDHGDDLGALGVFGH